MAAAAAGPGVVYAVTDTWVAPGVYTRRGETWAADDPIVAEHPDAFQADPEALGVVRRSGPPPAQVVEQATAAPGERRTVRRPVRDNPQA